MNAKQNNIFGDGYQEIKRIIQKRYRLILAILLIFISIAVVKTLLDKKIFRIRFTIDSILVLPYDNEESPHFIHKYILDNLIENFLTRLEQNTAGANDKDNARISADVIQKIETTTKTNGDGTSDNFRVVNITMYLYDTLHATGLINDLLYFINEDGYIKNCYTMERERLTGLREYYMSEFNGMKLYFKELMNNPIDNTLYFNIYSDFILLKEKMSFINSKLAYMDKIRIAVGPTCTVLKKNPFQDIILFGFLGLVIGLFVSVAIEKIKFL